MNDAVPNSLFAGLRRHLGRAAMRRTRCRLVNAAAPARAVAGEIQNGRCRFATARGWLPLAAILVLAGCGGGEMPMTYTADRGVGEQPLPARFREEIQAFFRTYLNDPVKVRDAGIADPVQRPIGGRVRYVACVRLNARGSDGVYTGARERAVVFVDGRLDRVIEEPGDLCAGVTYLPAPALEAMTR